MGIEWTLCSLGGAVGVGWGSAEPPDPADCQRGAPGRLDLGHACLPWGWRTSGYQEDHASGFLFNWGRAVPSPLPAVEAGAALLPERSQWQLAMPTLCLPGQTGSGLGPSLSLFFLGIFCTKTGAGMKSAYSTLACGMPVFPTLVLGMPLPQPGLPPSAQGTGG